MCKIDIRYDPAINSAPSIAKAASSFDVRPATAPTASPFFPTGLPPPAYLEKFVVSYDAFRAQFSLSRVKRKL
jgi:hypothetical protein